MPSGGSSSGSKLAAVADDDNDDAVSCFAIDSVFVCLFELMFVVCRRLLDCWHHRQKQKRLSQRPPLLPPPPPPLPLQTMPIHLDHSRDLATATIAPTMAMLEAPIGCLFKHKLFFKRNRNLCYDGEDVDRKWGCLREKMGGWVRGLLFIYSTESAQTVFF